jgi:hypothetical protein
MPATAANVTNTVALAFSTVGQVLGSRPELAGQVPVLRRFVPLTLLGGAAGAGLLLVTPPGAFERIVPFLVGGAALVLLFQPRIRAVAARRGEQGADHRAGPAVLAGIFAVAVYGGYFGAAAGVLMLALVLVGLPVSLAAGQRAQGRAARHRQRRGRRRVRPVRPGAVVGGVAAGARGVRGRPARPGGGAAAARPGRCASASRWPGSGWR